MINIPQPSYQPIEGTETCKLVSDYVIKLPDFIGKTLTELVGYISDGASIPKFAWSLVGAPFDPEFVAAAFIHDGLYEAQLLTRKQCDDVFFAMLNLEGVGWIKRNLFYASVRGFGWVVWNRHTKESIAYARTFCSIS